MAKIQGSTSTSAKKQQFVSQDKISLSFQQIHTLDPGSISAVSLHKCRKIQKLFLSHNHLSTLEGIESFPDLTQLSISHNRLQDIEELARLKYPHHLECLAVKGNFIDRHPDYKALLLRYFPKLRELDGVPVSESIRMQIKEGEILRRQIMAFFYKVDQRIVKLTRQLAEI